MECLPSVKKKLLGIGYYCGLNHPIKVIAEIDGILPEYNPLEECEKCFIGTLYKVNSNKNTFSIKQNNGEIIEINCADVEEIFSEEEIGTINNKLFEQGISIFAHDNVNMPLNQKKNTNPNRFKKY